MSSVIIDCSYQQILANYKPPWTRATLKCQNLQGTGIGVGDLDMRRKAEVLLYNRNQNNPTKKQLWAMLNKGQLTRKKVWATQGINYTNPNVNNLNFANNNQNTNILQCGGGPAIIKNPSTYSNVPGTPIELYLDPNVPLTGYYVQRDYPSGGTKWPDAAWQPGDDGFPNWKAGKNP